MHVFIRDAKRFALYNRTVIEQSPLQLYCSALIFAPENSIVRRQFEKEYIPTWIEKKPSVQANWSAVLQTLEGHTGWVKSVAFSPDSKQVVSGSSDGTVRLWDASTGALQQTLQQTLEGHIDLVWVNSVAFSPDSKQVVSGSSDCTIRLWDAGTGALQQTLEGHTDSVESVAFLPDGKLLPTLLISNDWVIEGRQKILWLPPECRTSCIAVRKQSLVLGYLSGRVSIIGFQEGSKFIY